jgi:hypothetical protein
MEYMFYFFIKLSSSILIFIVIIFFIEMVVKTNRLLLRMENILNSYILKELKCSEKKWFVSIFILLLC